MRLAIGLLLALMVNFGLFAVMHNMTSAKNSERNADENIQILDFVRLRRETRTETKKRDLPKKPPPPKAPPPPPKAPAPQATKPKAPPPQLDMPIIDVPLNIAGGPYLGAFATAPKLIAPVAPVIPALDGDVIPLVRFPPRYPRRAESRGLEGVVTISFTITTTGAVRDPVVVSATTKNTFDKAALKAILKWKFKPQIIDGKPIERQATQEIVFKLAD